MDYGLRKAVRHRDINEKLKVKNKEVDSNQQPSKIKAGVVYRLATLTGEEMCLKA